MFFSLAERIGLSVCYLLCEVHLLTDWKAVCCVSAQTPFPGGRVTGDPAPPHMAAGAACAAGCGLGPGQAPWASVAADSGGGHPHPRSSCRSEAGRGLEEGEDGDTILLPPWPQPTTASWPVPVPAPKGPGEGALQCCLQTGRGLSLGFLPKGPSRTPEG